MSSRELLTKLEAEMLALAKLKARESLITFTKFTKRDYQVNWHHEILCQKLDQFISGDIKRLLVFMPPQHGKSELVSRRLPSFLLGLDPSLKIVGASYAADLAQSFNRDVKRIINSEYFYELFPETKISQKHVKRDDSETYINNVDLFETIGFKGFYKSVGVGGSLTGTAADVAIIDDPVKDAIEAMSPTYRERTWNWFTDVLLTRLHNDSRILITQTRWDEDDLSGRVLDRLINKAGEHWEILTLPAIKMKDGHPDDPRNEGEALWEERHSLEKLERIRSVSIRTFESLYQQEPKPVKTGGEFYKGFDHADHVSSCAYDPDQALHITWDFNVIPYVSCAVWQIKGNKARQIDEICGSGKSNNTRATARIFLRKYKDHEAGLFVYGDPAGKHRDTRSESGFNDFDLIRDELRGMSPVSRVLSSAPPVVLRGAFINAILERGFGGISLNYDPSCQETINDMMYLKEAADGTKLKQKVKNDAGVSYEKYGHMSDANDYFLCKAFDKQFREFKTGRKSVTADFDMRDSSALRY